MKRILKTLVALSLLAIVFSCEKNEGDKKKTASSDVYFYGHVSDGSKYLPAYWKNDEAHLLDAYDGGYSSEILCMTEIDGHIYMGGCYGRSPVYWVDDKMYQLTSIYGNERVNKIMEYNGKIYMAGRGNKNAVIWIDGEEHVISELYYSQVKDIIAMEGGQLMYFTGGYSDDYLTNYVIDLYINDGGFARKITNPNSSELGTVTKLFNYNKNTYAYCTKGIALWDNASSSWKTHTLYKNLDKAFEGMFGYYIDGSDLYLYGCLNASGVPVAAYWKNGVEVLPEIPELNDTYKGSMITGLCVKDGNVQMVVEYYHQSNDWHYALVHDGKKISMDAGLAKPSSWGINGGYLSGK